MVSMLWFNLYPWFSFYFPLFLCMVMSDNEDKTKENKNGIKYKNEPQHLSLEKDSLIFLESLSRRLISKPTRGLKEEPADIFNNYTKVACCHDIKQC